MLARRMLPSRANREQLLTNATRSFQTTIVWVFWNAALIGGLGHFRETSH